MSAISSMYARCRRYRGRTVRIRAKDGNTYTGKIVKVDRRRVYLRVSAVRSWKKAGVSQFFPFVLPLVLFDLLAITLLF